jgi:hypothetical protein
MRGQGRERGMERESGGIINSPSCTKEMVDEGEVLMAFAREGVCVEGFYAVAKIDKAEGGGRWILARQAAASVGVVRLSGWYRRKAA